MVFIKSFVLHWLVQERVHSDAALDYICLMCKVFFFFHLHYAQECEEAAPEQPVEFRRSRKITKVPMYLSLTFAVLLVSAFLVFAMRHFYD